MLAHFWSLVTHKWDCCGSWYLDAPTLGFHHPSINLALDGNQATSERFELQIFKLGSFPCMPSSNPFSRILSWQQAGSFLLIMSKIMGIALNFHFGNLDLVILVNGKVLLVCSLNP